MRRWGRARPLCGTGRVKRREHILLEGRGRQRDRVAGRVREAQTGRRGGRRVPETTARGHAARGNGQNREAQRRADPPRVRESPVRNAIQRGYTDDAFLEQLAKQSLVAERAYAIVPHTSKAIVSVNCGIEPHLVREITEAGPDGVPARCLADLLKEQGYDTVWFSSATEDFEDRPDLVKNFGYDEFYPVESMDKEGFQKSTYFGYEDDIMLQPSREWLEKHKDGPFLATYLGVTGHHDYRQVDRYGSKDFAEDDALNRYQNEVRYLDFFVKNIIEQYKEMGLYDDTIFVIYGDHGEGFGEHDLYQHDNTIYEEGIRIPLIVHDPERFHSGERIETLTNQMDILPTVFDLLGYEVEAASTREGRCSLRRRRAARCFSTASTTTGAWPA